MSKSLTALEKERNDLMAGIKKFATQKNTRKRKGKTPFVIQFKRTPKNPLLEAVEALQQAGQSIIQQK